jgi:leucyl-tRNA synthetase
MKPWNTNNILGVRRFLERVWRLGERVSKAAPQESGKSSAADFPNSGAVAPANSPSEHFTDALLHQTIKKVTEDFDNLKINTAVSSMMILLNSLEAEKTVSKDSYKIFLQLLAPLAPHISAELWEEMGEGSPIYETAWPTADESKLVAESAQVAVQVNGKLRATIVIPRLAGEAEALQMARKDQNVHKWLALGKEVKAVYVAGKVINFVVQPI